LLIDIYLLTSHYRSFLTFSPEILKSAQTAYLNLKKLIKNASSELNNINQEEADKYDSKILDSLLDDLNVPKAIGIVWDLLQDKSIGSENKLAIIKKYDEIFSLNLLDFSDLEEKFDIPQEIVDLANQRLEAKKNKNFAESDRLRALITEKGFEIRDTKEGFELALKK
jgi:cysteinyl-tRNA synthetase